MHLLSSGRSRSFQAALVLAVFFCAASAGILYSCSDAAARAVWERTHLSLAALFLDRRDAVLAMAIGDYHFGYGPYDPAAALMAYQKAASIDPSLSWAHYDVGRVLFVQNKLPEARRALEQELAYHPKNKRAYYMLGLIDAYQGDLKTAESDFKTFVTSAPAEWAGYNDLSWVLAQEKKYAEARAVLMEAMQKVPDAEQNVWLWNNLGVQDLNLHAYAAAEDEFSKAAALAAALTLEEWRRAYPGNDPATGEEEIAAFQKAVALNLARARAEI